jgi:hypothetical protein
MAEHAPDPVDAGYRCGVMMRSLLLLRSRNEA